MTGFFSSQACDSSNCCNGTFGPSCSCRATMLDCGLSWQCDTPRDTFAIPTKAPYRIRIVSVVGGTETTILESTNIAGTWVPPTNHSQSTTYRIELCCDDPGYGTCQWKVLGSKVFLGASSCPAACTPYWTCRTIGGTTKPIIQVTGVRGNTSCTITKVLVDGTSIPFTMSGNNFTTNTEPGQSWPYCKYAIIEVRGSCSGGPEQTLCYKVFYDCTACYNMLVCNYPGLTWNKSYDWTTTLVDGRSERVVLTESFNVPAIVGYQLQTGCGTINGGSVIVPGTYNLTLDITRTGPWAVSGEFPYGNRMRDKVIYTNGGLRFSVGPNGILQANYSGYVTRERFIHYTSGPDTVEASHTYCWDSQSPCSDSTYNPSVVGRIHDGLSSTPHCGGSTSGSVIICPNTLTTTVANDCFHVFGWPEGPYIQDRWLNFLAPTPSCNYASLLVQSVSG